MSYLRYLCLLAQSGVQHLLRCVFVFVFLRLASISGLSMFYDPFGVL